MKDLAYIIVLSIATIFLILLSMLQAASKSLKFTIINSVLISFLASFAVAMISFEVYQTLDSNFLYKIMFFCQLGTALLSLWISYMPQNRLVCFDWQTRTAE